MKKVMVPTGVHMGIVIHGARENADAMRMDMMGHEN